MEKGKMGSDQSGITHHTKATIERRVVAYPRRYNASKERLKETFFKELKL